ncbi:response regulator transcription factor [Paenibacillus sp. GCM10012307]|uniref:Response regulator transcription factor n=1 Tax=Paenibacillus roseus TaxID=2798579 RepID=A0A934J5Z5_9BACL|nr:response regulator transcription factor [Paenibacillus roseus]MBJ6360997.1 response regulator transcription factor [Paenibacillus roseus]
MHKILIVEDDPIMGDMLSIYLQEEGYLVQQAHTGLEGLRLLAEYAPDIVLLDLMLPDWDGIRLCTEMRGRSDVPIMVVSMKTEVSERVEALKAGADDYLCKPFSLHELTARVYALIRRAKTLSAERMPFMVEESTAAASLLPAAEVVVDQQKRTVEVRGERVETTYSEFELLRMFISQPGRVFSREDLINAIRGDESFVTDRAIDVHIVNLRKKIERNAKEPKFIRTVWGVGYKYMLPEV